MLIVATILKAGVRVPYNGQTVDADEMDFSVQGNGALVVHVEDGAVLHLNHSATAVYRLLQKDAEGAPLYLVTGTASINKLPAQKAEVGS